VKIPKQDLCIYSSFRLPKLELTGARATVRTAYWWEKSKESSKDWFWAEKQAGLAGVEPEEDFFALSILP